VNFGDISAKVRHEFTAKEKARNVKIAALKPIAKPQPKLAKKTAAT